MNMYFPMVYEYDDVYVCMIKSFIQTRGYITSCRHSFNCDGVEELREQKSRRELERYVQVYELFP